MNNSDTMRRAQGRINRRNISEDVIEHLRRMIFVGDLRPHQRIPQDEIAEQLQVSRLPVREALFTLEAEGLVYQRPRRGAFVSPITRTDVEDHYEIYGLVHGMASARTARVIDPAGLQRLRELHSQMQRASTPTDSEEANWQFHRLINVIGGSRRLRAVLLTLSRSIPRDFFQAVPGAAEAAITGHERILTALHDRDPDGTAAACRLHLQEEGALMVQTMERSGFWSTDS